jgi:hypothetical protein
MTAIEAYDWPKLIPRTPGAEEWLYGMSNYIPPAANRAIKMKRTAERHGERYSRIRSHVGQCINKCRYNGSLDVAVNSGWSSAPFEVMRECDIWTRKKNRVGDERVTKF